MPDEGAEIVRIGEMIKAAAREQLPVIHPDNPDIAGISILEFTAPPTLPGADAKNTVVISTGVVRLGRALHLDRRARPLRLRHRHLRPHGGDARQRAAPARTRTSCTSASSARPSPAA